ncbi:monovalent cation/H+ antiporter complex subunit F [Thiocystis violascens]|uniref:Multisubunit Na+/H+ antiporter, MnhF subunit n=1 Tax=Thiocystis violascens (strain ATCC 17096 / DSM 198 / 6111) TaxID=765911 RepID=I3Y8R4_THIV6|nr:monovalent cation/H+ antiporter complex subunit F [Thiocystis violascens]AFL73382.1 multisubunit Na+/H+ antiporter, MnhF subunit [Thiocystis violascens DSM 198]
MTEFLLGAAAFVLGTVALGLIRLLRGPGHADRMLAAQLLGTGGVAALLLLGVATGVGAIAEVALLLALLAAFASVAFVSGIHRPDPLGTASMTEHAAPGSSHENKRDTP